MTGKCSTLWASIFTAYKSHGLQWLLAQAQIKRRHLPLRCLLSCPLAGESSTDPKPTKVSPTHAKWPSTCFHFTLPRSPKVKAMGFCYPTKARQKRFFLLAFFSLETFLTVEKSAWDAWGRKGQIPPVYKGHVNSLKLNHKNEQSKWNHHPKSNTIQKYGNPHPIPKVKFFLRIPGTIIIQIALLHSFCHCLHCTVHRLRELCLHFLPIDFSILHEPHSYHQRLCNKNESHLLIFTYSDLLNHHGSPFWRPNSKIR